MKGLLRSTLAGVGLVVLPAYLLSAQNQLGSGAATDSELRALTSNILSGLGAAPLPDPDPTFVDPDMRAITDNVLAGLGVVAGNAPAGGGVNQLSMLVTQALTQGRSDAYIESLIDEAVDAGMVSVPAALTTSEGRVDTATLRTTIFAETLTPSAPITPEPDVPVVTVGGQRFYTVQSGDSLGGIAFRVYGRTSFYTRIFEANKEKLGSPDRIFVGQRLIIPLG